MTLVALQDSDIAALRNREITQVEVAAKYGVPQSTLSQFIKRRYPELAPGRGGLNKSDDSPTMQEAVRRCVEDGQPGTTVASDLGVPYHVLSRLVAIRKGTRRAGVPVSAQAPASPTPTTPTPPPTPPNPHNANDATLLTQILNDPVRLARVAAVIRAAGL